MSSVSRTRFAVEAQSNRLFNSQDPLNGLLQVRLFDILQAPEKAVVSGESVSPNVWIPYESGNLLETLDPRPFFITSIQIYASGWDYDSYVTGIRLIVE
jgi:hypothetical protein